MNPGSFLAAIREDPADDLPRLVFADWLEDSGDHDRAEFIRVQCELTRGVRDRGRSIELLRRLRDLSRIHRTSWLGSLQELAPDAMFERGFVEHIRVSARQFIEHAEAIFEVHPIRQVRLERVHQVLADLLACPHLALLESLDFQSEPLRDVGMGLIGCCRHLGRLRSLDLSQTRCSAEGVRGLLAGGMLAGLESLSLGESPLSNYRLGNHGVEAILQAPTLPALQRLDLSVNGIDERGAALLANSERLGTLRFLRLQGNPLGRDGVEMLGESRHLGKLEILDVRACGVPEYDTPRLRHRFGARILI